MKKTLLVASILVFISVSCFSQSNLKYGPVFGLGVSDVSIYTDSDEYNLLAGYHLGMEARIEVDGNAIIRAQLRYASAGTKVGELSGGTIKRRINYLDLPLLVSFDFGRPEGFLLTLGIHGSLGVGGRETLQTSNGDTFESQIVFRQGESTDPDVIDYKPFNTGWNIGIGIKKGNVIVDAMLASTFSEEDRIPFIITIKGGVSIMLNHSPVRQE